MPGQSNLSPTQSAEPLAPRARPPGKPTPDEALAWLTEGNASFFASPTAQAYDREQALSEGQEPIAVIVGCSDSRAAPEILFNCRLGDLFVVRVAGATVAPALGSIDYGVQYLHCPLVVVLGHSNCGAVTAATAVVTDHAEYEGSIRDVVLPIVPAVLRAQSTGASDLINASVREHVERSVRDLASTATLAKAIDEGRLKIVGCYYDLKTRKVEIIT
jgi:carbonic anhydrase